MTEEEVCRSELDYVEIICEAGVNHNGSVDHALELVDRAADAGADVIKFQTFRTASLVTAAAPKADYQNRNAPETSLQREMLRSLELETTAYARLLERARQRKIQFLSTPFDPDSMRLLTRDLHLTRIKVSSGDLTNAPLLLEMAREKVDIIISTGMATMPEIEEALSVLAFGYLSAGIPSRDAFRTAYDSAEGQAVLKSRVAILHCTSDYPANPQDVNLRAMDTLHRAFGLKTGYSDHTTGIEVAISAAARGARLIEKHMTLDKTLPGPDHKASLEPAEFAAMVSAIRLVGLALGSPEKKPTEGEIATRLVARKTIVAASPIVAGEKFTTENLTTKRAGGGLAPVALWDLIGQMASRTYAPDEVIEP